MTSSIKALWNLRWLRFLVWAGITLLTIAALLITGVNWYGARKWQETAAKLNAAGLIVQFRDTLPEPISADQNFCAVPLLDGISETIDHMADKGEPGAKRTALKAIGLPEMSKEKTRPSLSSSASLGKATNMVEWAAYLGSAESPTITDSEENAARAILKALSKDDAFVEGLAKGLDRPEAQWTPAWKSQQLPTFVFAISVPHLSALHSAGAGLALRATAAARAGDPLKAHQALLVSSRLTEATMDEPFLIGFLVSIWQAAHLTNTTWELCNVHSGSPAEFKALQEQLQKLDFPSAALQAWTTEFAGTVQSLLSMKSKNLGVSREFFESIGTEKANPAVALSFLIPEGWIDLNVANLAQIQMEYTILPSRQRDWIAMVQKGDELDRLLADAKKHPITQPGMMMASFVVPSLNDVSPRVAYTQCTLNQAIIACVLEGYYAQYKTYPDTLNTLKLADGSPLPQDILNKVPMSYRKTSNGRYALWCAGYDGKDDGGVRKLNEKTPDKTRFWKPAYKGDWVWDFPAR